ncbi:MAG: 2-C-methyl-D-erythritol 2,4-cyclodiphosphate synthase [Gammaproteobacteria bacterium]|nr:2-C-methyl-D-erythritol 2,4-cyclodiphosphate synthase [Gammaproteobacteria bacterium]
MIRIGNGIDVHRFDTEAGDKAIVLGGISIPHTHALLAHSDGDVLTHALMDALLGALGLGDIGQHFPDTVEKYRDVSSMSLLDEVMNKVNDSGWQLGNADITVVAQAPRLSRHIESIKNSLAAGMKVAADLVSVKATTSEGLGFTGRGEGIAVLATVLLTKP